MFMDTVQLLCAFYKRMLKIARNSHSGLHRWLSIDNTYISKSIGQKLMHIETIVHVMWESLVLVLK